MNCIRYESGRYKTVENVEIEWLALQFPGSNLGPKTAIVTEVFRGFPHSLLANSSILPQIKRPLLSIYF
jgi:hypothetical protein